MRSIDIGPLVKGALVIIGLAIATGHYDNLASWSRKEAARALTRNRPLPYFFEPHRKGREDRSIRTLTKAPAEKVPQNAVCPRSLD
jgi:hypothetical protein